MKIMSDAIGDKEKYNVLNKLGLSDNELYGAISKQVGFSYLLPLIVGGLHGLVAIKVLERFFNEFLEISLIKPFLLSLGIYVVIYILFYTITTKKFVIVVTK